MKNARAPVSSKPMKAKIAPGRKVLLNCSLLIRQAMINTAAAMVNGTGKLVEELVKV